MRTTVRRALAATGTAAALSGGLLAFAPSAAAQPTVYDPVITPCSDQFRTAIEFPKGDKETYWSPFGTSNIACYDDGTGIERFYQQDPGGNWHNMNELMPGQWFYDVFTTGIPNEAQWG